MNKFFCFHVLLFLLLACICCVLVNAFAVIDELISPVTTEARYPFWIGSALTTAIVAFDDQTKDPAQQETVEHKPLGKYSKYGDLMGQLIPNAAYLLWEGGRGLFTSDQNALTNASLMFSATAYSGMIANILKVTVRERRPSGDSRQSFPSGHTTVAFAFASVVGMRNSIFLAIPAYLIAAVVGYSRMNDNRHWLHDVVAGATLGLSYGVGICSLESGGGRYSMLLPTYLENKGPMLTYIIKF
ncbi:MAG: phosphatase PAP2 family protein [Oligoflexia bacterium]|nr:phosphatase PAP2 family protein [Oligoflexia bacterium]